MESVILPLADPPIRGYLHHAFQLSILMTKEAAYPWVYSQFIQLYSDQKPEFPIELYMPDQSGYNWNITSLCFNYRLLDREMIQLNNLDIVKMTIEALKDGYYLLPFVNERYLPGTHAYQREDHNHLCMIYGYDQRSSQFHFTGYDIHRQYTPRMMSCQELHQAYHDNRYDYPKVQSKLYLVQVKKFDELHYYLDLDNIIHQLENLLYSRQERVHFIDYNPNTLFGLNVYDALIDSLMLVTKGEARLEFILTSLHLLSEHKGMMVDRVQYLSQYYTFGNLESHITGFQTLQNKFNALRNAMIKYQMTKKQSIMDQIVRSIQDIWEEEKTALSYLISDLTNVSGKRWFGYYHNRLEKVNS